jgi:hypothetical protein
VETRTSPWWKRWWVAHAVLIAGVVGYGLVRHYVNEWAGIAFAVGVWAVVTVTVTVLDRRHT